MTSEAKVTTWRPPQRIRVLAIGLAWRDDRLLVFDVTDDSGRVKGVRPIGGAVEFGERAADALAREFAEELGATVCLVSSAPTVLENLFQHHGVTGHEVVLCYRIELADPGLAAADRFTVREPGVAPVAGRWIDAATLMREGIALYPDGLAGSLGPPWA